MENMIGAKALMKALEKEGVKEVFGLLFVSAKYTLRQTTSFSVTHPIKTMLKIADNDNILFVIREFLQ